MANQDGGAVVKQLTLATGHYLMLVLKDKWLQPLCGVGTAEYCVLVHGTSRQCVEMQMMRSGQRRSTLRLTKRTRFVLAVLVLPHFVLVLMGQRLRQQQRRLNNNHTFLSPSHNISTNFSSTQHPDPTQGSHVEVFTCSISSKFLAKHAMHLTSMKRLHLNCG